MTDHLFELEANEALNKKDFIDRVKIARKETKKSLFFRRLLDLANSSELQSEQSKLIDESTQLLNFLFCLSDLFRISPSRI